MGRIINTKHQTPVKALQKAVTDVCRVRTSASKTQHSASRDMVARMARDPRLHSNLAEIPASKSHVFM